MPPKNTEPFTLLCGGRASGTNRSFCRKYLYTAVLLGRVYKLWIYRFCPVRVRGLLDVGLSRQWSTLSPWYLLEAVNTNTFSEGQTIYKGCL